MLYFRWRTLWKYNDDNSRQQVFHTGLTISKFVPQLKLLYKTGSRRISYVCFMLRINFIFQNTWNWNSISVHFAPFRSIPAHFGPFRPISVHFGLKCYPSKQYSVVTLHSSVLGLHVERRRGVGRGLRVYCEKDQPLGIIIRSYSSLHKFIIIQTHIIVIFSPYLCLVYINK